jgi:hypothetical protein
MKEGFAQKHGIMSVAKQKEKDLWATGQLANGQLAE